MIVDIAKIFKSGGSLVSSVKGLLDEVITTKEEAKELDNEEAKAEREFLLEEKRLGIKEQELYLSDKQNARSNETLRDNNENSSWLSKNIHEMLAVLFSVAWLASFYFKLPDATAAVKDAVMLILAYLFGSRKPQV